MCFKAAAPRGEIVERSSGQPFTNQQVMMMNILLLTCQSGMAGSTNSICYLAAGLAQRGHSVYVGCKKESILYGLVEKTRAQPVPMTFKGIFDIDNMRQVRDVVRRYDIQVINAQSHIDRYTAIFSRWLFRLPVVLLHTRRQPPRSSGGRLQNLFYTLGTDAVVAISDELKRILVRQGYPATHVSVIHNGTPASRYRAVDPERISRLRQSLDLPQKGVVIGCISRKKKQDQLIRALAKLDPHYTVLLAGVEKGCYDTLAAELGIRQRIVYAGFLDRDDVLDCYPLCTTSVLCSTTDGFGLVLVEAMAYGVPVVATRSGGIIDVIQDRVNGLLYDDGDIDMLARQIDRMVNDALVRERCIQNGRHTAFDRFSLEKTVEGYERLYEALVGKRRR
jgi:L-malate glycosyltransferase